MHPSELEVLASLASNKRVLEVGSFMGLSAWAMAITAKDVLCLDTFRAATDGQRQTEELTTLDAFKKATARFSNVQYLVMSSEQAHAHIPDVLKFDMIFIDAMHTYDGVKGDIERWWPRLVPGGIFAMHDYGHHDFPGVKQAADELLSGLATFNTEISLLWLSKALV